MPYLRRNFLDYPIKRSSHTKATPKGAGLCFVLSATIFLTLLKEYTPLLFIPLALIGLLDDKYNIPRNIRYISQFSTSLILILITLNNLLITLPISKVIIIIFIWQIFSTGLINFINFMDGIDGLVALLMIIITLTWCVLNSYIFLPLVFSLFGFIIWNWSPAKVFMGDVGSTYLGVFLCYLIISNTTIENSIGTFLVAGTLWIDPLLCLVRRKLNNQNIFDAHRLHLYQRLVQAGISHSNVSMLYGVSTLILAITSIFFSLKLLFINLLLIIILGIWLDKNIAIPFNSSSNFSVK